MLADGVINMVVAPEVSSIDPSASIVINNLSIPGMQTRRAKTVLEIRDGESFAMAGLIRKDFQDTIRKVPLLGSLPIIGTLFRSTGFQHEETELVIIVTPRLIRPVPAGALKFRPTGSGRQTRPTCSSMDAPTPACRRPSGRSSNRRPRFRRRRGGCSAGRSGGTQKKPIGFEKDYGHVL